MNYFYIFLSAIIAVNTLISVITVFSDRNRDIAAIWAWLLVLNIFPVFGLIIYLFLGRKISKEDIYNLREQSKVGLPKYLEIQNNIKIDQLEYIEKKDFNDPKNKKFEMAKMLMRIEQPPISLDNEVEYFVDGREKFDQLIADIKKAEHHVHVSYYIFKGDKIGKRVVAALEEVAKKGVEVRVQYDPVGG